MLELGGQQVDEIDAGHLAHGRRIPRLRIERRFNHGLRFFQLWKGDALAASTWMVHGGTRYIDELALAFPLSPSELWVRDIFVAPNMRRLGMFGELLTTIIVHAAPQSTVLWSDVDWSNTASIRAHQRSGFSIEMRLRALDFGRRYRLRSLPRHWPQPLADLEPARKLLTWNATLRQRHRTLIA